MRRDDAIRLLKSTEPELRARGVLSLSLFGSTARDEAGPDSDVDVLVEFDQANVAGKQIHRLSDDLSALFGGRKVDLVSKQGLRNPYRRHEILTTREVLYAA